MKILYLSTPSFADCDIPLIRSLQKQGCDVTYLLLLAPHNLKYTIIDIDRIFPKTGVFPAHIYPGLNMFQEYIDMEKFYVATRTSDKSYSLSYLKKTLSIWKFIRENDFDVVHTTCLFGLRRLLFYFLGKKIITTIHDPFPHTGENNIMSYFHRKLAVKFSSGIVLLNEKQKDDFCNAYKVEPEKILVSSLGVYENISLLASDMVEKKTDNVLFFGRISPYKGIEYLCEAMQLVRKEIKDATLTIAGSGNLYFDITPYLSQGYIEIHNRFIRIDEVATMLNQCSLCACPYTDATQSGVIMTSFALGKPVVASDVGGLSEVIENEKSGLLVEPRNPEALAGAIIKLLKNPSILERMEDYIRSTYYSGERSWHNIAEAYMSLYNRM